MQDLDHFIGGDLSQSVSGDFSAVAGSTRGQQRILRRLLTNPGDYIFQPDYGAGLPQWVGRTVDIPKIRALIRTQMLLEDVVAKTPEPVISVSEIPNGLSATIQYTDAQSLAPEVLSFNVTA